MSLDHSTRRPRLGEIARGGLESLKAQFASAQAVASDPLPAGIYRCLAAEGRLFTSQVNCTPGYKLTWQVVEGPHTGRRLWQDLWLTPDALGRTKYDLLALGITELEQLEQSLPPGLIADVVVTLRSGDDGVQFNRVRSFCVLPTAAPGDDFAPPPDMDGASDPPPGGAAV